MITKPVFKRALASIVFLYCCVCFGEAFAAWYEFTAYTQTIHVAPDGNDQNGDGTLNMPYRTLRQAVRLARPGMRILLHEGRYQPGQLLTNLQGTEIAPITIMGATDEGPAEFVGGTTGLQLSDPRYVILQNFSVSGASENGINIDDGGSYNTPAEYITLRNLSVRNIGPSGNRDGIKLSGVDHFRVEGCEISSPGDGGSAIDMVGCHDGLLAHNRIEDCQNNGIQAKGGSARLLIYGNRFINAGGRAINMGGSTGMQFFRPLDAAYEAADNVVWANVFTGSTTPIAFVGSEYCLFAHNTVYLPTKWIARILQENNHSQLIQCRNNVVANNIIVIDDRIITFVNVGPNTNPTSFIFASNLWFHINRSRFSGPTLPVSERNGLIQADPLFVDVESEDFHLQPSSPAIGAGEDMKEIIGSFPIRIPELGDRENNHWENPPSVGAYEGNASSRLRVRGWEIIP